MPLTWLHLSNLRIGAPGQRRFWLGAQRSFYSDVESLLGRLGSRLDVICLTGGLTDTGSTDCFSELRQLLDVFCSKLPLSTKRPQILVVPGPSDAARIETRSPAARLLNYWFRDAEVRSDFFDEERGQELRAVVQQSFAAYRRWLDGWREANPYEGWAAQSSQLQLPGDFGVSSVGSADPFAAVGLNSAFLQSLQQGPAQRPPEEIGYELYPEQLNAVTVGQRDWLDRTELSLLLTYHPPRLLHRWSEGRFKEISPGGRFAVQLCAAPADEVPQVDVLRGSGRDRGREQGLIFEGRPFYHTSLADERSPGGAGRIGYSVGQLSSEAGGIRVRILPRIFNAARSVFVPDHDYELTQDEVGLLLPREGGNRGGPTASRADSDESSRRGAAQPSDGLTGEALQSRDGGTRRPLPSAVRALLSTVLRTDSDLSAFCLDYFPEVYRRFSSGMDTVQKHTLLLQLVAHSEVLERLRESDPSGYRKHEHLLRYSES
jgi:hypothetical protein